MYDLDDDWPVKCSCGNEFTKTIGRIRADGGARCFDCGRKLLTDFEYFSRKVHEAGRGVYDPWQTVSHIQKNQKKRTGRRAY